MRAERMDGAGEVKNVLREEMADERRRLKEEHAAQQEARRLKREAEQQRRAEAAANGQVRSTLPRQHHRTGALDICFQRVPHH